MPSTNGTPLCPNCHSPNTERLPFDATVHPLPIYSCLECGHVWRDTGTPLPRRPNTPKRPQ
jgi:hypothetical protein